MTRLINLENRNIYMMVALYIIPLTGLSIDIYVPSLPNLALYYHVSDILAQNTISMYILGLGISQLVCGNIIDYYGRRITLLIGLLAYLLLSISIVISMNIQIMSVLRVLQGLSMGFIAVSARSIFLDIYHGEEYYRKASYMTIAYSIGPIIAPAIGGFLEHLFGWRACFYFLMVYSLFGFMLVYYLLPETMQKRNPINLAIIVSRYKQMLSHKEFCLNLIALSMLNSALLLFGLVGPFIVQSKLHYSAIIFGQMALLCGVAWFAGNLLNRLLIKVSRDYKIKMALIGSFYSLVIMLSLAFYWFNLYVIIIPICIILMCGSVIFSSVFVHSPTFFPDFSATAAAFMAGSFGLLSAFVCWILTSTITTESQIPLIIGYFSLFLIIGITYYINKKTILKV